MAKKKTKTKAKVKSKVKKEKKLKLGTFKETAREKLIGQHITSDDNQLRLGSGYDHCWVLNGEGDLQSVCKIVHKDTGRLLEVFTTEPGIQIYTGNHLEGIYNKHSGVCLETQHFPNSPNEPKFPTVILNPEDTYRSTTIFKFSIQ